MNLSQRKIFDSNNLSGSLIKLAVPAMLSLLVSELYSAVDSFFVGVFAGEKAIAALTIVYPIQRLIIALSLMLSVGCATMFSWSFGAKNRARMEKTIFNAGTLALVIFGAIPIAYFLFGNQLLYFLGGRGEILKLADSYARIVVLGSPFLGLSTIIVFILSALGRPRLNLACISIGALLNMLLDYILLKYLNLGVFGAALATLTSQILSLILAIIFIKRQGYSLGFSFNIGISARMLAVGFTSFIVEISDAVMLACINNLVLKNGGSDSIVIIGVITRLSMFLYTIMIGFGQALSSLSAYNLGKKCFSKIKKLLSLALVYSFLGSLLLWLIMMIFAEPIIGSFLKDRALMLSAASVFRKTMIIFPLVSFYYESIYIYQAMNKPRFSLFLSLYRQLILFIPLLYLLTEIYHIQGVWLSYPVSDAISATTGIIICLYTLKRLKRLKRLEKS